MVPGHTVVWVAVLEDENMSGSRIVHIRGNLGSCEGPMIYVMEVMEPVSVAAHEVDKRDVQLRPTTILRWGVHTWDPGTVDVDPENLRGVNLGEGLRGLLTRPRPPEVGLNKGTWRI